MTHVRNAPKASKTVKVRSAHLTTAATAQWTLWTSLHSIHRLFSQALSSSSLGPMLRAAWLARLHTDATRCAHCTRIFKSAPSSPVQVTTLKGPPGSNHHIEPDKPGEWTKRRDKESGQSKLKIFFVFYILTLDRFGNFNQTLSSGQATGPVSFTMS